MAKITIQNIQTVSQGMVIYKFPASDDKPQTDFTNADFYFVSKIIREGFGEDTEYILNLIIPPVLVENLRLSMETTKTYAELTNGKWYTYKLEIGNNSHS